MIANEAMGWRCLSDRHLNPPVAALSNTVAGSDQDAGLAAGVDQERIFRHVEAREYCTYGFCSGFAKP